MTQAKCSSSLSHTVALSHSRLQLHLSTRRSHTHVVENCELSVSLGLDQGQEAGQSVGRCLPCGSPHGPSHLAVAGARRDEKVKHANYRIVHSDVCFDKRVSSARGCTCATSTHTCTTESVRLVRLPSSACRSFRFHAVPTEHIRSSDKQFRRQARSCGVEHSVTVYFPPTLDTHLLCVTVT